MADTGGAAAPADARGDADGQRSDGRIRVIEWRFFSAMPEEESGMRSAVISTFALAVALVPAVGFAHASTSPPPPSRGQAAGPPPAPPPLQVPGNTPRRPALGPNRTGQ